jgi:hypothetical protein
MARIGNAIADEEEKGAVDHELDGRCKVYENGRVAADPETLRLLKQFSEREIAKQLGYTESQIGS